MTDSESYSVQPELAGQCSIGKAACDFNQTVCPFGGTCSTDRGCPKYGDYNGNAAAAGRMYSAWASAIPPLGATAPGAGINIYANVSSVPAVTGWSHNDLTNAAGGPGAAGDPAGYTWDVDSTQHVVYRGTGHIHELWFNGTWNHDLPNAAGGPGAAGDPAGYTWDVDSTQHVVYRGTDGHIHELWFNGTGNHNDLPNAAGGPGAAGDPTGYTRDVDSTQHVVYRGTDGHIHELWFNGT